MVYAITTACQRGLEVQLFVSEIGDQGLVYHAQRSYYDDLLEAGVKIFLYPAPFILHSKHFSIDDDIAVIGSSNMDIRSFSLNMEVSLLVLGESFVAGHARGRAGLPGCRSPAHPRGVAPRTGARRPSSTASRASPPPSTDAHARRSAAVRRSQSRSSVSW